MREVWQLTWSYLRQHPGRLILTCLAVVAAGCMVIWVVSGYDALLKQFREFSGASLGRYTLAVYPARSATPMSRPTSAPAQTPGSGPGGPPGAPGTSGAPGMLPFGFGPQRYVSPQMVEVLRADPAVATLDPMWAQPAMVRPFDPATFRQARPMTRPATMPGGGTAESSGGPAGPGPGAPRAPGGMGGPRGRGGVTLIGTDAVEPPYPMASGRWIDPRNPDAMEAALSVDAASRLGVGLGGEVAAGIGEKAQKLTVVGIVDVPVLSGGGGARRPGGPRPGQRRDVRPDEARRADPRPTSPVQLRGHRGQTRC